MRTAKVKRMSEDRERIVVLMGSYQYKWRGGFCMEVNALPNTIVVFGATGDLAGRKLLPALFQLAKRGLMHERSRIVGCGRTPMEDQEYREFLQKKWFSNIAPEEKAALELFLERVFYHHGDYGMQAFFLSLEERLGRLESGLNPETSGRIYYLAVPPSAYHPIIAMMSGAGLLLENQDGSPWRRVILEKPFGHDYESACKLDHALHQYLTERQIYRIDHYLGKETVQNIMILRFANLIFEPVWNAEYIDYVQITAAETVGVEHRAGYFDQTGILRDMFQNHILEMLSLVAMEQPAGSDAESIRNEKLNLLQKIRPIDPGDVIRGQYEGYREEPGVNPESKTETFAAMKLYIDNSRWKGVPFYLRSGKKMAKKQSSISIHFKPISKSVFYPVRAEDLAPNVLTMNVQPEEGISLSIQAKQPGPKLCIGSLNMDFKYASILEPGETIPDSYERLLLDCMLGDQTLFIRSDTILKAWELLTPILTCWSQDKTIPLYHYPQSSHGPAEANILLREKKAVWLNL